MQIAFTSTAPSAPAILALPIDKDAVGRGQWGGLGEGHHAIADAAAKAARFDGEAGAIVELFVADDGQAKQLLLVGVGSGDEAGWSKAGGALVARLLTSGATELVADLSDADVTPQAAARFAAAAAQRAWRYDHYRTKLTDKQKVSLTTLTIAGAPDGTDAAWAAQDAVTQGLELTRNLVAAPPNILYPETFVEQVRESVEGLGLEIIVLGEDEMREHGMGALLGVSQGSVRDARILALKWNGAGEGDPTLALVGKGVTFDTGGISLKPGAGMEDMKWDMGGAGAVAGTMKALAARKAKVNVVGVMGLVENMPDGNAQRPGDVVTSMSGQTIEILNTDAEGRLVLCDAITWTQQTFRPKTIIDLATLTGAMIVSLGNEYGGLFSNDDGLADKLLAAGTATGDKLWRFPLSDTYNKLIDSPIADMKNVGPRGAGSITAAQFIQRFVDEGVQWAHLDIAGMVWSDKAAATYDKGATGYGVKLLDRLVAEHFEG
ncbi:leucyl aminopeptidase [Sphingomonas melonis TY]|jgi:leucyl aminopeptidase|uniref:Probable cytosol aminopeptidase n=1 Tax=Sphingomonas melonis TY TaxID=621456 RepID=A0A154NBB3_9SPHN|nr:MULTISPECIES: leucyl aminopeptidase [Sphingomonas]AOW23609.1 leucyl aminopeptidase [Sphingomonas melonis TY]KZB97008.1 leucyl aminopeptidase [Sphingomonas melonis TY]MBI0531077.1 leucyl aminopeptidase [Sphingomonas sp. TX0522]MBX8844668.1 leucyl aminopeptidase [Sphingomonas melonis]MBX8853728.1 leucyl aminopeptidase [Sphingomonas melonis]